MSLNPLTLLQEATKKVPALKYAFGIVGIAAVIAIIKGLGIKNASIPIGTILLVFALLILFFVFSVLVRSKNRSVQSAGVILLYAVVLLSVLSGGLLISSIFFDFPKPISKIAGFSKAEIDTGDDKKNPVKDPDHISKTGQDTGINNNATDNKGTNGKDEEKSPDPPVIDKPFKEFTLTAGEQHVMNDLVITLTMPSQFPGHTSDANIKTVKIRIWRNITQPLSDTAVLDVSGSQPGVENHVFKLNAITPIGITDVGQFKFYVFNPILSGKRIVSVQVKMYRN